MRKHITGWDPKIAERKNRNVEIFNETMAICTVGGYETPSGKHVALPPKADVLGASRFYVNPPDVKGMPTIGKTDVCAVNEDCVHVARDLVCQGLKPIMLNMANRHTPGGGVLNGARAQEESLFRESNLCESLYQYDAYHADLMDLPCAPESYPMDRNTGGVYSDHIMFFREGARDNDVLVEDPFTCAVVSVAAINSPELDEDGRLVPWAVEATLKKIRTMLRIGLLHGHDAIVLGAWGCGAFRNPPEHMAELFHEVLNEPEFANKYKVVRFAIIEDHNSNNRNFKAFAEEFGDGRAVTPQPPILKAEGETMMDKNKAKGMLWGLLVGDAFGSPVQFSGKDVHPWITEMVPCPVFNLPAGYWTDDGSMALCVMDSFVRKGGYDLRDIGATFVKWLDEGYLSSMDGQSFDVGSATFDSVYKIKQGSLVNGVEESQGNGSIMRFAPSYLIARALKRSAIIHEVSDLTHASNRIHQVVDRFASILDEHLAGQRTTAVSPYATRDAVNNSGWAVSTLEAALWAFNTTSTFEEGLIAAVNLGGDSDSIGAVYGQIAGAYYGFDAIPARWIKAMKTSEKLDERIERFIDTLRF